MNRKFCGSCSMWKPTVEFYKDRSSKDGLDRRCKECSKAHLRAVKERNRDKMLAARNARHAERMANDPEYRERVRRVHRENARKRRATPEGRRKMRAEAKAYYIRIRNDPEKWQHFLDRNRSRVDRIRDEDPERYADMLEARRVNRRLRRLENGQTVRDRETEKIGDRIESAPLKPLVEGWIRRFKADNFTGEYGSNDKNAGAVKALAKEAGVSEKLIYRVRNPKPGDGDKIEIDSADLLCCALGYTYSMIYGYEGEEE